MLSSPHKIASAMYEMAFDDWPDQLPELGQAIRAHSSSILKAWEELIEKYLPTSSRTIHRVELRDHLPQFLDKLSQDLIAGREGRDAATQPVARQHGIQRWQQGWELELVIRDYQLLLHAIITVVSEQFTRDLTNVETQNLTKLLQEAGVVALRTFLSFRGTQENNREDVPILHGILENCNDAVIELSLDGTILYWNQGAEKIYGYHAENILGSHIGTILPPDRQLEFDRCIAMLKSGRDIPPFDTMRRRGDGTDVSVSITASPVRAQDGTLQGYVSIARDISDRVRAAEALRDALEEAERASRAKSEFLANVSHELRTPMNAIIGMTELALDEELSPDLRDYLETTRESADLLLTLVNDVLDISKLESGKFVLDEVNFNLRDLVDETVRSISSRAFRKGLEIACRVAPNVPAILHGDSLRLRQILTNLVGNAIKFTDEGEIVVEVKLNTSSGRSCVLQFSVSDTGIGISPENQQRIFAPFTQADASSTRRFAGTGLGLSIATHLINCFQGQFWVDSQLGAGSTFYFTTRLTLADDSADDRRSKQPAVQQLRNLPVLVADDNDTNREIITKLLAGWHMAPISTNNARTALDEIESSVAQGKTIPLAVIDAIMPGRDGFQLIEDINLKSRSGTKTILMLSAADRIAFKERCQELDFDGVLEKPISQSNLFDAIVTAMGVATVDPVRPGDLHSARPERILNVLLAEDTPANRKVVDRVLTKRGHNVTSASNGRETVDLFRQNTYDVILMDVQMPSMDGLQATEAIRACEEEHQAAKRIPIIAMTAHAMVGDRHRCLAAGMDDYISKPINIRRLIEIVESYGQERPRLNPQEKMLHDNQSGSMPAYGRADDGDIMDLERALRRLDGDHSLLIDLIGFFLEDYPGLLAKMDEAATTGDASSLERAAHSMKGLVANFDAHLAKEIAQQIETASKERDMETAVGLIDGMKSAAAELAKQLELYRQNEAS